MSSKPQRPKKLPFGLALLGGFCVSWTGSLLAVYLLVPVLHEAFSASLFAIAASFFLLGFCAALGFLVLRPVLHSRVKRDTFLDFTEIRLFGPN